MVWIRFKDRIYLIQRTLNRYETETETRWLGSIQRTVRARVHVTQLVQTLAATFATLAFYWQRCIRRRKINCHPLPLDVRVDWTPLTAWCTIPKRVFVKHLAPDTLTPSKLFGAQDPIRTSCRPVSLVSKYVSRHGSHETESSTSPRRHRRSTPVNKRCSANTLVEGIRDRKRRASDSRLLLDVTQAKY